MAITLDSVIQALRSVVLANAGKDILSSGMVKDLKVESGEVSFKLSIAASSDDYKKSIEAQIRSVLKERANVEKLNITLVSEKPQSSNQKQQIPGVKNIIAVSSGKGGVGKSTVSTNLAVALSLAGFKVGLLDTDVYGPNIPTMLGISGKTPYMRKDEQRGDVVIPLEACGIKVMSMGFLTQGDQPLVWRGPMLHSVVNQFLNQMDWGELDFLIVDMPPGTGDVQLSLTQLVSVTGAVVVTTPQEVALQDVRKAILMFDKVQVPVLGVVENMSYFVCDSCDKKHTIFGSDGGKNLALKYKTQLLAEIPLNPNIREGGDNGRPIVLYQPQSPQAKAFMSLANAVVESVSKRALQSSDLHIGSF